MRAMKSETTQPYWNILGDQATHWQMVFNLHEFNLMYTGKSNLNFSCKAILTSPVHC